MALESHLRTLLYDHDCVIIPEFGGFLTRYRPAHIHALQQTLVPPSKVLTFNRRLVSNDGLIAQEIMRREGVSFDQAMAHIQHRVAEMEMALASTQRVVLEGIGTFHADAAGTLQFTPEAGQNFLKDAFGLASLALDSPAAMASEPEVVETEVSAEPEAEPETPVIVLTPSPEATPAQVERTPEAPRKKRRWMVAAVALPLVAAGVYFMRDTLPLNGQRFGFLNAPSPVVASEFQPRFPEEDIVFPATDDQNRIAAIAESNPSLASIFFDFEVNEMSPGGIRVVLNAAETAADTPTPEPAAETPAPAPANSNLDVYFVVGGAFSKKANADRLVGTLQAKGFDAYVFGQSRGLHLVCYGSYTNKVAARKALAEVKASENAKAWLKRH